MRVHANFALTETGRNRSWQPNILNWPKAITKPIERAFERINILAVKSEAHKNGAEVNAEQVKALRLLSDGTTKDKDRTDAMNKLLSAGHEAAAIDSFVRLVSKPISVRSAACAPEGHALVDMDLKTAEIVSLAYLSGDQNLMRVLTEPDLQFARVDKDNPKKAKRICYNDNVRLPESARDASLLIGMDDPSILRDAQGQIMHPLRDMHWELTEATAGKPRELLSEDTDRSGIGKVGNFSVPYGATGTLLERMIEANTGVKPPEGTGDKMILAHAEAYPTATDFQLRMERCIEDPGFYRSISGRVRHFFYTNLGDLSDLKDYTREGILSPLKRQARNFPHQELVAATTARALLRFIKERRERGMSSRIMMLLYDAMTGIVPFEELKEAVPLLRNCLTIWTPWTANGKTFNFDVDVGIGFRWGVKPTKEEKALLAQYL